MPSPNSTPIPRKKLPPDLNGQVSTINITLKDTKCPGKKLVCFVLSEKTTSVNKANQPILEMGAAILGVMGPH